MDQRHRDFRQLQQELPPFDYRAPHPPPAAFQHYREYYHLNFQGVRHTWGKLQSGDYALSTHVFTPAHPRGTILLMHGYLDHTGLLQRLIQDCLQQGYYVALYDLPGHGLSTGPRGSIRHFSEYVETFRQFLRLCRAHLPQPYHLISHSTGSAIVLESFAQGEVSDLDTCIFLAPLVRYTHWTLSKMAYWLSRPCHIATVPRSSAFQSLLEPEFIEVLRSDPLQIDKVPLAWVRALYAWEKHIQAIDTIPATVFIIQGTQDRVVNWKYNIPFLQRKFSHALITWIKGAGHQVIYEHPSLRDEAFQSIHNALAGRC